MIIFKKTALITGATSGIGKSFAKEYAKMGFDLIITGQIADKINIVAKELKEQYKVEIDVFIGDLSKDKNIDLLIEKIKNTRIDVLINNAGFGINNYFQEHELDGFLKMIGLHIVCVTKLTSAVITQMINRNEGTIINVASDAAYLIIPKNAIYSGTKAFVKQFSEGLHLVLNNYKIKVQALCPGLTTTDFQLKLGMDKIRQRTKGILRWEEPEQVVKKSMKYLDKDKVVCLCGGFTGRIQVILAAVMPKKWYYNIVLKIFASKL